MFVRMLTDHCDQNDSYEITINGFQVRKINEIRNVIFGLRYGKPSSALRPNLGCSPSWVPDAIRKFWGKPSLNNKDPWPLVNSKKIPKQSKNSFLLFTRSHRSDNFAAVTFNIYRLLIVEFLSSLSDRFFAKFYFPNFFSKKKNSGHFFSPIFDIRKV